MPFDVTKSFPSMTQGPDTKSGFDVTSMPNFGSQPSGNFDVTKMYQQGQPVGQPGVDRPLTQDEFKQQWRREQERGVLDKTIGAGVSFATEGVPAFVKYGWEQGVGAIKEIPKLATQPWKVGSTAGEAALRGTFDFLNIGRMPVAWARDKMIKATTNLGPEGDMLVDYNRYLENFKTMRVREQFERGGATMLGSVPQALGAQVGMALPETKLPETIAPEQHAAELASIVLDPSLLVGGVGKAAGASAKASSLAARTAARSPRLARGMEIASGFKGALGEDVGAGIAKMGRGVEHVGKTKAAQFVQKATPAVVGMSAVGAAMGAPMAIAAPMAMASAGLAFAKRGGQMLSGLGDAVSAWSRTEPGRIALNRLQQVALDEAAPEWLRRTARRGSKMGLGRGLEVARNLKQAAKAGTAVAAIPALTGTSTAEEAGQMMGMGAGFGALGHVVMSPVMRAGTRRAMEDVDIASWHSGLDEGSKHIVSKLDREGMLKAATLEAFINSMRPTEEGPGVLIRYADDDTWAAITDQEVGPAGVQAVETVLGGERPAVTINVDRMADTTLGHEVFHALSRDPRIVDQSKLRSMLFDQIHPETGEVMSTGLFDSNTLAAMRADYLGKFDAASEAGRKMHRMAGEQPTKFDNLIREEVTAELFGAMLGKADSGVFRNLDSLTQRKIDAWLTTGEPLTKLQEMKKAIATKLGLYKTQEGNIGSHIYPGLETSPKITAELRNIMRARLDVFGEGEATGPRVRIGDEGKEVHAEFDAREVATDPRLAEIFKDADVWQRNEDGTVKIDAYNRPMVRTAKQMKRVEAQRAELMTKTLEQVDVEEPGAMKLIISDDGTPRWSGRYFTDPQIEALTAAMPGWMWPPSMTDKLRMINEAAKVGMPLMMNYNPALLRNKYASRLGMTLRMGVPLKMDITKAGNFVVTTVDLVHLQDKLGRWWDADQKLKDKGQPPKYFRTFESLEEIDQLIKTYLTNHQEGRPGQTGLHADPKVAMERKHILNDLFNIRTDKTDPLNPRRLSSARKEKDTLIRSRRFDRINSIEPAKGDPMPLSYESLKMNYQPGAEDLAVSAAKEAPEPSQARGLAEDAGVSPKPPGETPGTSSPFGEAAGQRSTKGYYKGFTDSEKFGIPDEWKEPGQMFMKFQPGEKPGLPKQEISSKATSLEQVPAKAFYGTVKFPEGARNADIGAGKSELFTEYLKERGVENLRYDRFWQKPEEVAAFAKAIKDPTETATVNNVLNVIKEPAPRDYVIRQAAAAIKADGTAYFKIYEGDGTGKGKETAKGYQNNRKATDYVKEIEQHFSEVTRKGDVLIATKPKAQGIIGQDIMFQPGAEPEKITHAALRVPDNEGGFNIYVGPQHFVAIAKASRDMKLTSDFIMDKMGEIDGFVTDKGRFVSRQEAYRLHYGEEKAGVLDSGDVPALKERAKTETVRDVLVGDVPSNPYIVQREARNTVMNKKRPSTFLPDGGGNAVVGGDVRYSPGSVDAWAKRLRKAKDALRVYGKDGVEQIIKAAEATRKVMAPFSKFLGEELKGSPLRENADPLFTTTFDLSTVCPQQDLYVAAVGHVEAKMGRILAPHERYAVGLVLQDMGQDTACWYCYGQIKRDIREKGMGDAVDFNNKLVTLARKKKGKLTTEDVQSLTHRPIEFPIDPKKKVPEDAKVAALPGRKFTRLAAFFLNNPKSLTKMDPLRVRDIIRGKATATPKEAAFIKTVDRYTASAFKENKPKGWSPYTDQIATMRQEDVDLFNSMAGMRMNSQTDFRPWHVLDLMQGMADARARGLAWHVYTKTPDFLNVFGDTGIKFNMSVEYAHDASGNPVPRSAEGGGAGYKFNDMEGMPDADALRLREEHAENAGTMLMAFNPKEVELGMADPNVDMIIPYHKGGVPQKIEAQVKGVDMSAMQHEHFPDGWGKPRDVYMGRGKTKKLQAMDVKLSDGSTVEIVKGRPITRREHKNSKKRYLEICEKAGITPKFEKWKSHPGYMKLIRDVAREPGKQSPVDPNKINWKAANEIIERWGREGGDKTKLPAGMKRTFDKVVDSGLFEEKVQQIEARAAVEAGRAK